MSGNNPNRIASEDLQDCNPWLLPDVSGKVIPSAEKEAADRERHQGEVIEDVSGEEVSYAPMTADELQALTDAAEKEGFDKGHAEGLAQGQAEGHKQGYEQGLQQAQQESAKVLDDQVGRLLQIAEALMAPIGDQEQQLEHLLLSYVTRLTRQLVERELQMDSAHILSVVQRAVAALPSGSKHLKVILNPDDLALVEAYAEETQKDWGFRGDAQLSPGGCRIETDNSLVDFSVESRIDAMLEQFLDRQLISETGDVTLEPLPEMPSKAETSSSQREATEEQQALAEEEPAAPVDKTQAPQKSPPAQSNESSESEP
ncbi:flagellar assembly protein FliH [Pseudomaricurvus alkylphenolicus]|uniref:flagellar assembly protein FliH n=1 Tax=Pseudomaricurvus alkylphenolicus TaxID=1306991 RepID=UPI0014236AFB|nr:flagellar assembly protein FliH [Pseudomaricurvus alkylphenolicus]NIB43215.1 flagellar assembly protein FliH [Pseudomaricurvus alkylphenolicus]